MLYCGYGNFTGEEDDLMQDRKLEQALEIYFQENPDRESDKYQEIQKYLKLRIRSVMELLFILKIHAQVSQLFIILILDLPADFCLFLLGQLHSGWFSGGRGGCFYGAVFII